MAAGLFIEQIPARMDECGGKNQRQSPSGHGRLIAFYPGGMMGTKSRLLWRAKTDLRLFPSYKGRIRVPSRCRSGQSLHQRKRETPGILGKLRSSRVATL